MRGQASIEGLFYYIILLIGISAVIYMIFNYIQQREQESVRYSLYTFQSYIQSKYNSLNRLGNNSYVELYLPPRIAGRDYYVILNRSQNDHTAATVFVVFNNSNFTYTFSLRGAYIISDSNRTATLMAGRRYLISVETSGNTDQVYIR